MPQFSHQDRRMIEAEETLWNVVDLLNSLTEIGAFSGRVSAASRLIEVIAKELQGYNDQFETEDE